MNHAMFEAGKVQPPYPEKVTLDYVQTPFEDLQGGRLHSLSR